MYYPFLCYTRIVSNTILHKLNLLCKCRMYYITHNKLQTEYHKLKLLEQR